MTSESVSDKTLIAAYGLCHPGWSRTVIRSAIRREHMRRVKFIQEVGRDVGYFLILKKVNLYLDVRIVHEDQGRIWICYEDYFN